MALAGMGYLPLSIMNTTAMGVRYKREKKPTSMEARR